ncbi:MAG: sugar phosphate isomerase/epimerase [Phycisphaerae bacterium]|nr:sugar phosphate isomerase/epimerase [Phycisphaerae bacterium]
MTDNHMTRRDFVAQGLAGAAALGIAGAPRASAAETAGKPGGGKLRKATQYGRIGSGSTPLEKLKLAKDIGWEGIECDATENQKFIDDLRAASDKAGIPIHGVVCATHWRCPLSDPDPAKVKIGMAGMRTALKNAKDLGATSVLLVPAVVSEAVSYKQAYDRSQKHIRELLPMAEEYGITIGIENVWNKFLLSPLEFSRYVDEFGNKYARSYFDIGNVVIFGFPQDWIRTLGPRISRIHLKDFKRAGYKWTDLLEGDVNWPECIKALKEVGYDGWLTTEVGGGDEAALRKLHGQVEKILSCA